jgi:hypothetical protein
MEKPSIGWNKCPTRSTGISIAERTSPLPWVALDGRLCPLWVIDDRAIQPPGRALSALLS